MQNCNNWSSFSLLLHWLHVSSPKGALTRCPYLVLVSGNWPPPAACGRNMRLHPRASGSNLVHIRHPSAGQTPLSQKRK